MQQVKNRAQGGSQSQKDEAAAPEARKYTLDDLKRCARKLRLSMPTKQTKQEKKTYDYFSGERLAAKLARQQ